MVGITAEKDRAKIERLYNGLKRMGYLPVDAPGIPALVDQTEASNWSTRILHMFFTIYYMFFTIYYLQQYNICTASALDLTIMFSP